MCGSYKSNFWPDGRRPPTLGVIATFCEKLRFSQTLSHPRCNATQHCIFYVKTQTKNVFQKLNVVNYYPEIIFKTFLAHNLPLTTVKLGPKLNSKKWFSSYFQANNGFSGLNKQVFPEKSVLKNWFFNFARNYIFNGKIWKKKFLKKQWILS